MTTRISNELMLNETESGVVTHDENDTNNNSGDTNEEEDDENGDNRDDVVGQNNNNESNSNGNRESQNEMLLYEESLNLKCYNCQRKQCSNLVKLLHFSSLFVESPAIF